MSKLTAAAKSTKVTKVTKSKVKETPVEPVPEVEVTATATATVTVQETVTLKTRFDALIKSKQEQITSLKSEIAELRKMQKDHEAALKEASKKSKRRVTRVDGVDRKPSGFASPVVVSDELYTFLAQFGVKKSEPVARTDVTRHITAYIKQKDLQNPEHRREIVPDAALKALFGPALELKDPNDEKSPKVYTYLKLQKYLSKHFPSKLNPLKQ